jgi:hypothetical protein
MSITPPKVVLRIGSHAEKAYFEKLAGQLDAIMFGGNLLEITPTATASLLVLLRERRGSKGAIPFYLDPMTYCFGSYIDPGTGKKRMDLHALKSTRKDRKTKKLFTAVKDSYDSLGRQLGSKFEAAVNDGVVCKAIDPWLLLPVERDDFCNGVVSYQLNRIEQIIAQEIPDDDEVMRAAFSGIGKPAAVFAPYFFVHDKWADDGLKTAIDLATRTAALKLSAPVHAVVCASRSILSDAVHVKYLIDELPKTNAAGVWLWFDGFDELQAPRDLLVGFRNIVRGLNGKMEVYNLHGGYFSLLLAHDGLTGISHGVGYGEQKPVPQVIGAAVPTVRYYLPPISKRLGVPDIQLCYQDVGITTPADFFAKVCDCQICKGVIGSDLARFASFGEMHRADSTAQRDSQTPAAAKLCRFHFLIKRFKERARVAELNAADRSQHVTDMAGPWRNCRRLQQYLGQQGTKGYIELWAQALK